ncbi:phospholipid carrier-dependent glycosyltransferase, partial [Candidatus Omnitrophota bacterium]
YGIKEAPNLYQLGIAHDKGYILKELERGNITYYDQPLHHIPFGFPLAIMASHKIFSGGDPYYLLAINDVEIMQNAPPGVGLRNFRFDPAIRGKQFYSVIVPLVSSLLLIIMVYFLAKRLYSSENVGLIAMFLMAISPIDILTSQKVWADDMTAFLMVLAVLLYIISIQKKMPLLALVGGLSCGASAITKQSGAFIIFVIVIWHFVSNFDRLRRKETFLSVVFDKYLILFGLGALAGAAYWFLKVHSVYGSPIYRPHQPKIAETARTAWFKTVGGRPWPVYLIGIPFQNPLFTLAYISPLFLWLNKKSAKNTLFGIIWIAVFLYIFQVYLGTGGKELRYMLPAYPAFAILGAYVANYLRVKIDKKAGFSIGTIILVAILAASVLWCVPMAYNTLFFNGALITRPF